MEIRIYAPMPLVPMNIMYLKCLESIETIIRNWIQMRTRIRTPIQTRRQIRIQFILSLTKTRIQVQSQIGAQIIREKTRIRMLKKRVCIYKTHVS